MKKELRNKIIRFQISCIILFFISVPILLWMLKTPSSNKKVKDFEYNWQNAVDVVPQSLLAQVKSSLPETKLDKKSIKVLKISLDGGKVAKLSPAAMRRLKPMHRSSFRKIFHPPTASSSNRSSISSRKVP